ncbi:TIGR02757 family protein [Sulfurimonas marina]|uniref:TIGR02757 family protein n=1 Tax=Sulfurimonas marina TaxID=2590551 RepID=A0A7M1AVF7_9BACT|nr:TIGR02757 family protein [Sulfurimonas marina]QOP41366.1 TIGR02757 family protein [Sulfurimonas marina]
MNVKELLDREVALRNSYEEVCEEKLDPIIVARKYNSDVIALICSLFAYGNVKQIVKFLDSLDFSLLQKSEQEIEEGLKKHYYRFQTNADVIALFIALKRLEEHTTLEDVFVRGYKNNYSVIEGINAIIEKLYELYPYSSRGYTFLVGKITTKTKGTGALKRWMMWLRWMVRSDEIDLGLWSRVDKAHLIMPLDTHTFNVSRKLGLLKRKTYDLHAAIELTETLKGFDNEDPLKYDFALYRLGQEKIV